MNNTEEFLFDLLIEGGNNNFRMLDIVEIETTKEKNKYFATIKGDTDGFKYERKLPIGDGVSSFRHVFVFEKKGHLGDEVFGFKLIPISETKYLKVSYNC